MSIGAETQAGRPLGSGYVLHERIGSGAMGLVWRASRVHLGEDVAVKTLRPDLSGNAELVSRFVTERQAVVGIRHPNLVQVHDLVVEADTLAIVMDLVDGPDLRQHLAIIDALSVTDALALIDGVLAGLEAVHAAGIVHRDVKPENLILEGGAVERVRLTDFGIARVRDAPSLTRASGAIGTPTYMAPELAGSEDPTPAVDQYAAGVLLYELLAGRPPFDGGSVMAVLAQHLAEAPMQLPGIPDELWPVLERMLSKDPAQRFASCAAARKALMSAMSGTEPAVLIATPPLRRVIDGSTRMVAPSSSGTHGSVGSAPLGRRVLAGAAIASVCFVGLWVLAGQRENSTDDAASSAAAVITAPAQPAGGPASSTPLEGSTSVLAADGSGSAEGSITAESVPQVDDADTDGVLGDAVELTAVSRANDAALGGEQRPTTTSTSTTSEVPVTVAATATAPATTTPATTTSPPTTALARTTTTAGQATPATDPPTPTTTQVTAPPSTTPPTTVAAFPSVSIVGPSTLTAGDSALFSYVTTPRTLLTETTVMWDWGNGRQSSGESVGYGWPNPGTYTVTLTVTSPRGRSVATHQVNVHAALSVSIGGGLLLEIGEQFFWPVTAPGAVSGTFTSDCGVLDPNWRPGLGWTGWYDGPPRTCNLSLTVVDAAGNSASTSKQFAIVEPITARLETQD